MYQQLMTDIKKKLKNSVVLHLEKNTTNLLSQQAINAAAGEKSWSKTKHKYITVKETSELSESEITHWFRNEGKFNINATLSKS